MAAQKHPGDVHPAQLTESDIDLAGYDPYIVAITGGLPAALRTDVGMADADLESRKVKLMSWLREHGK